MELLHKYPQIIVKSVHLKHSWLFHFQICCVRVFIYFFLTVVSDWERPYWHSGAWPQPHHRKHHVVPWRTVHLCGHQLCWRRQERFPCHNSGYVCWILLIVSSESEYRNQFLVYEQSRRLHNFEDLTCTWSFLTSASSLSQSDKQRSSLVFRTRGRWQRRHGGEARRGLGPCGQSVLWEQCHSPTQAQLAQRRAETHVRGRSGPSPG